jgi:hypothetical protein
MFTTTASVPTENASKYLTQLCKHWSHKLDVELAGDAGTVRFSNAVARMKAGAMALAVTIEAEDQATLDRMKEVVASHLDRFAFREAPLQFNWS